MIGETEKLEEDTLLKLRLCKDNKIKSRNKLKKY